MHHHGEWIEDGLKAVVGWGRLQWRLAALLAVPVFLTGMYGTNYVFLARDLRYRCRVPECEGPSFSSEAPSPTNGSVLDSASSADAGSWQGWALVHDRCSRRRPLDALCTNTSFHRNETVPCHEFVYQQFDSIVYDFDLGCKEWLRNLVGTIHNIGMLISLPIMGYISDRWGRRTALLVSGLGAGVFGFIKSFSFGYWMYVGCELLETVLGASVYPAAFVLMLEWLSAERRELASLALGVPLSLGGASLALLAAAAGGWRVWARFAYPPSLLLLPARWLIPESVRWLAARGRHAKARRVLQWAAKSNSTPLPEAALKKAQEASTLLKRDEPVEGTEDENLFKAFFKYSSLRRRLCVCGVWWMSGVFVVYGLWVRAAALAGDLTTNYVLLALVELPALLANTLLLARAGRRAALRTACLLTAAALTAMPLLPSSCHWCGTVLFVVGKAGANMTLNALYVYSAELFPTRARQRLLAACSALGRLAGVLAPLTPMLTVYGWWVPTLVFGSLPLVSAALTLLLPDTLGAALPHTLHELQRQHELL